LEVSHELCRDGGKRFNVRRSAESRVSKSRAIAALLPLMLHCGIQCSIVLYGALSRESRLWADSKKDYQEQRDTPQNFGPAHSMKQIFDKGMTIK
jgi:hypothetical protein